jgi:membrane protein YdbS with pleckstrin-like domain
MYFRTKHDFGLGLLIWGILFLATIPAIVQKATPALAIMIVVILFAGWIWFGTGYEILDDELRIRCGPFRQRIPLQEIREIKRTRSPLSSPACSLDRIEIKYGKSKRVMISPADKENFIKTIIQKSPQIQLDEDLRNLVQMPSKLDRF